jgi:hypothetical protein
VNICIIVNKDFTVFFSRLAPYLESAGHKVFWISPSRRWALWLKQHGGVADDRILSLPDKSHEWRRTSAGGQAPLLDLEGPHGITISNVILMCRSLRYMPADLSYAYLSTCRKYVEPFLDRHSIDVCFGEPTWGFEILIWLVCRRMGIPYLHPHTVRVPGDRFAFFDAVPHQIPTLRQVEPSDREWATSFYREWTERPRQPAVTMNLTGAFNFRRHWWRELAVSLFRPELDRHDLTLWPISRRISSRIRNSVNRIAVSAVPQFSELAERKYVLLCLHLQPESTIDVFGSLHSDQAHFVERIVRMLPSTHELWVKEHRASLGEWPLSWRRKLRGLPNVRLIDPRLSTFDLMRGAALVISVAGTASYEAALLGTSAVAAVPIFFSPLMALDAQKYPDPMTWPWHDLLAHRLSPGETAKRAVEFLAWLHAQSFPGFPFDPFTVRDIGRAPENVEIEARGFLEALAAPNFPRKRLKVAGGARCPASSIVQFENL